MCLIDGVLRVGQVACACCCSLCVWSVVFVVLFSGVVFVWACCGVCVCICLFVSVCLCTCVCLFV